MAGAIAQVQKAQPPPEFTSGYVAPQSPAPIPRAELWVIVDVIVLCLVLFLGARAILTHRSRAEVRLLTLFSVAYFGFYRQGCVCSIGSIQNVVYAVTHPSYALPWTVAAFFLIPLTAALFLGRIFCGTACPMGALQDLVLVKPLRVPSWLLGPLGAIPYLYLGAAVMFAGLGTAFIICELDPYVAWFRLSGPLNIVVFGAILLAISLFVGRPYCRFLCPYGVLLRWAALFSKFRVSISPAECVNCHLCADACPYGAIEPPLSQLPRARKATGLYVAAVPVLMLLFAYGGYRLSPTLAKMDARVVRAIELTTLSDGGAASDPRAESKLLRAEAWRAQRQEPAAAVLEARTVLASYRTWSAWLGAWFGLVIGLRVLALTRRVKHETYEAEPGACVSCARCYASCPVPNRAKYAHLGSLTGGTE